MSENEDFKDVSLNGLEQRGATQVLRDVAGQPGLETTEGRLVPLLSGDAIKAHIIVMHPGQYGSAHAHETESIIYTISGRWVSCTTDGDAEIRTVVNTGDLFRFGGGVPTGYETPFDDPAVILILKGGGYPYDEVKAAMLEAKAILEDQASDGEPFSYAELASDHPAVVFAREVTGRDPIDHFGGR